mgnify:CR=1 FL=1
MLLSAVVCIFLLLGAVDYALGNRFSIGQEFENGLLTCGRLIICMAGFMVLAPVLAHALAPVCTPFFHQFGIDPSAIAGLLVANDSGGAVLAMEMAEDPDAGLFHGLIVGAAMGTGVMFTIPISMSNVGDSGRPAVICGLLAGIVTIPLGCLAGGFVAGFSSSMVIRNTIPVLIISIVLFLLLLLLGKKIIPAFTVFGRVLELLSIFGLCCGAIQHLTGITLFPGMGSLAEIFPVLGGLAIFLAGAFPMLAVIKKFFSPVMTKLGQKVGMDDTGTAAFLLGLANGIPSMSMLGKMNDYGRVYVTAFLVSGSCILGDHAAYTVQVAPEMSGGVMAGKAVGAISAMILAAFLAPHFLPNKSPASKK